MSPENWTAIKDLGGWGVVALFLILGGKYVAKFFERALSGFENALTSNQLALTKLGEAVDTFRAFETEEKSTHKDIVQTQKEILVTLVSLQDTIQKTKEPSHGTH